MSWLLTIGRWLLGLLFGPKDKPAADLGKEVGKAQAELAGQEEASAEAIAAARARRDADTERVLRDARAGQVHADPADPINADPDLHLRD
jgi:hypothetical protein